MKQIHTQNQQVFVHWPLQVFLPLLFLMFQTNFLHMWVVDPGETDHMTSSFHLSKSYSPSPSYEEITIPNGSVVIVAETRRHTTGKVLDA